MSRKLQTADRTVASPTEELSRYIVEATYAELPSEVVEAAKACVLDSLGCTIGGTRLRPAQLVMDLVTGWGGAAQATVLGVGSRIPAPHAAYVNAYLNNVLDFDDTGSGPPFVTYSHPASSVIPAALAVGEWVGASGSALLHAVVLGYEVSLRIGQAIMATPARYKQVWGLSTWQIFGAITAAAKLLRLNLEQTRHALGLGALNAPVPYMHAVWPSSGPPYGWSKNNYGWASMGAVLGCVLAQQGFVGNPRILDGEQGFWVMAGSDRCDTAAMTAGLGREYLLPHVGFKPYASCRSTHTPLDAIRSLQRDGDLDPARITSVDVYVFSGAASLGGSGPESIIDAQFHVPYLVALELLGRSARRGLIDADLEDTGVRALAAKVRLHLDPEADREFFRSTRTPTRVVVRLQDGTEREGTANVPTGTRGGPAFTRDDLEAKFETLAAPVIGSERARALLEAVRKLDRRATADLIARAVPPTDVSTA